jgi:hypothetical protein
LPQLEKAGVWVFRKVALRKHPDAQELLIVLLQLDKIADEVGARVHRTAMTVSVSSWP